MSILLVILFVIGMRPMHNGWTFYFRKLCENFMLINFIAFIIVTNVIIDFSIIFIIITSAEEVMFLQILFVCLFVGLFASSITQNVFKFRNGMRKNRLNFGGDWAGPDCSLDP